MNDFYREERGIKLASVTTYEFSWKNLKPVFGHLRPDQVTRAITRAYAAKERRRGISDGTIRRDLGVLSAIIRYSDKATTAVVEMPPMPPPKSRHLSREQYRGLRDAARSTAHLYLFVVLAYRTGARAGAVLELTWDRVDFARNQILLGTGERRAKGRPTVPMRGDTAEMLSEYRKGAVTDYVIEFGAKPVRSVKKAFARAAERAGVPWCTPHVLRHSAAVHMIEGGASIDEVGQFLGHTDPKVTYRVYARFSPQYLRKAEGLLE